MRLVSILKFLSNWTSLFGKLKQQLLLNFFKIAHSKQQLIDHFPNFCEIAMKMV